MEVTTRECTKCQLTKSLSEFDKAKLGKFGVTAQCKTCKSKSSKKYRDETEYKTKFYHRNKERIIAENKEYYQQHKDRIKVRDKNYRDNNVELIKEQKSKFYKRNVEKIKKYVREHYHRTFSDRQACSKRYRKNNRGLMLAFGARYRASKLQASPSWANQDLIRAFYVEANRLSEETGIKHHVDHIHPLQHKLVCGLHVEQNLQILTAEANLRKSNRFIPYVESDCKLEANLVR